MGLDDEPEGVVGRRSPAAGQVAGQRTRCPAAGAAGWYGRALTKFGDSVRSKTDTAMVNEALCKVLCHNVCCLIQSARELGIEAKFWRDGTDSTAMTASGREDDGGDAWDWV
jgi:hypothetical protein